MTIKKFESLKAGDKVRVKKGLITDNIYGGFVRFDEEMSICLGKIVTITNVHSFFDERYIRCALNIGGAAYSYSKEMIEHINPPLKFGR